MARKPISKFSRDCDRLLSHAARQHFQGEKIGEVPEWLSRLDDLLQKLDPAIVAGFAKAVEAFDPRHHLPQFAVVHELTPAETKLLDGLSRGQSLADYAKSNHISVNTARVHRQRILEKCGVNSQTALLEKVFTFTPAHEV